MIELEKRWDAGEQVRALSFYLSFGGDYTVISSYYEGSYQGECYAVIAPTEINYYNQKFHLWRDSFGSCSGCDALADCDIKEGYDYIKATLQEGNTRAFDSLDEADEYLNMTDDYFWKKFPKHLLIEARNAVAEDKNG